MTPAWRDTLQHIAICLALGAAAAALVFSHRPGCEFVTFFNIALAASEAICSVILRATGD